jgi:glycosyltransferase involved in cell wall biosynthesis
LKIAIGLPAYNEEKNIASIIIKLKQITNTIIVCDDGSSDLTSKIASELGATTIVHQKNMGYGAATASLFSKAMEMNADVLVTFDADGQHRIEDIKTVLEPINKDEADIVIGSRFLGEDTNVPRYRKLGIKTITGLTNVTTGTNITDAQSGFRAYNKKVLESISPTESGMGVSTEILIKAAKNKFRLAEVPITILYEGETSTHNPISHGTSVILSTIKYVAMERPLTFYGIPGVIFLAVGLFFVGWTIQLFGESGEIVTNVSLIGVGCTILGVLLLMTATILHSIVSIVKEQKSR